MKYLQKNPNQHNFSLHKSHSHRLAIEQFPDIYNRSWSRNRYITIVFLILLILTHGHVAVITNTTTTSLFRSANTNLRMWSCTAVNVRCCHSTEGKSPATQQQSVHSTRLQQHILVLSATSVRGYNKQHWIVSHKFCPKCHITLWMQGCVTFIQQTVFFVSIGVRYTNFPFSEMSPS